MGQAVADEYLFSVYKTPPDLLTGYHLVYAGVRWITDRIFIQRWHRSGGLLTEYSFSVCRDPEITDRIFKSVYEWVRQIAN